MMALVRHALATAVCLGLLAGPALAAGGGGGTSATPQDSNYVQGRKLVEAGDFAAAVPLLQKAIAVDPKNADAYNYLGYSHRRLGDKEAALTHYLKALELKPEHRGANEYLGELYLEMGRLDEAKERLDVLDGACFFGCPEYRELKAAIKAYQAKAGG
ncbi:MAG: tetratricopeptide repeat protein [Kiloniellaceae bacterium]